MLQLRSFKYILLILAIAAVVPACKKDNEKRPPSITHLRAISPAPNDSTLTIAGPGQNVVIFGSNLGTATEIYFNGYRSPFNAALIPDNTIPVTIPADMPFASLEQSQLNTVRVVTVHGDVTFQFPIIPPPPTITAMSNEMALAGERVTITGNNFFFIDKVRFPGGIEVSTNLVTNASGTTLEATVPAGITQSGPINVINRYGTGTSILRFNDTITGVIHNSDNINNFEWGSSTVSNPAMFPGGRGNYSQMEFTNVTSGDFGWWNGGRSINTFGGLQWIPAANLNDPLSSYALKFELFTKEPWTAGRLYIVRDYDWTYLANYQPWMSAAGASTFNTNGWKTVVIPLTEFRTKVGDLDGTGESAASLKVLAGNDGKGSMHFFFVNPDASTVAKWNAAIDNIRIVKIN